MSRLAVLHSLLEGLKGECYGDKGYMSRLFEHFYAQDLQIITKLKARMANQLMCVSQKIRLKKRAVIESVNHILTSVFDLEHTRHRNRFNALAHINALAHLFSGLIAYCFYDTKPAVFAPNNQQLMIA